MARQMPDLPTTGRPNSSATKLDSQGKIVQRRFYGADGRAIKNIDYGHDHNGAGDPHAHDWDWNMQVPRQGARALKPGE